MEFVTTTVASVQEIKMPPQETMDTQASPMVMEQEARETQAPTMDMLASTVTETSTIEPIVSQAYIENQMR